MASSSSEKLQMMVECPVCLGTLKNPKALLCLHFYCEPCIDDLKLETEGTEIGYKCPLCRQFTAKAQIRPMHFVNELLEVIEQAKMEQHPCAKCKTESSRWRCISCKDNYCVSCREHHDGFAMFKNHVWKAIDEASEPVMDKHIFCPYHSDKLVEVHCQDCSQLICIVCNGTKHKTHVSETIEEALDRILPTVNENAVKLDAVIATTQTNLADFKAQVEQIEKQYEKMEANIKNTFDELMNKAKCDFDQTKEQLQTMKKNHMGEIKTRVNTIELKLKSQTSLLKLANTTLATAQGTSMMKALESGLLKGLQNVLLEHEVSVLEVDQMRACFKPQPVTQNNIIGVVVDRHTNEDRFQLREQPAVPRNSSPGSHHEWLPPSRHRLASKELPLRPDFGVIHQISDADLYTTRTLPLKQKKKLRRKKSSLENEREPF